MKPEEIFQRVKKSKRKNLTELEAREILTHYKIPVVKGKVIKRLEEAKNFAKEAGYPVVLVEVMIGGKWDPTFGQTIAFGLGGIFVEVFQDVSFRIVPIEKEDALEMIREIKAYRILKGYRGKKPVNVNAIVDILLKTSKLLEENQIIKELDINPVFALPRRAIAGDARIIIE